jgi:tetratricopeptide (TPR) repeat protein
MRQRVPSAIFTGDPAKSGLYPTYARCPRVLPQLSAAAFINAERSRSHELMARYIEIGEQAQAARNGPVLAQISREILSLSLVDDAELVGMYYAALSLNRQGPPAYAQANALLSEVADHGPQIFRAKARVALGTNLNLLGDAKGALSLYADALGVAKRHEYGGIHPLYYVQMQRSHMMRAEGNFQGATSCLRGLSSVAYAVGTSIPPLFYLYCNNLAAFLAHAGQLEEAAHLASFVAECPFPHGYPEWRETCLDIELRTRTSRRSFASVVGLPVTAPEVGGCPYARDGMANASQVLPTSPRKGLELVDLGMLNCRERDFSHLGRYSDRSAPQERDLPLSSGRTAAIGVASRLHFNPEIARQGSHCLYRGAAGLIPQLSAAAFINAERSRSHELMARYIEIGEQAQAARNGPVLAQVSREILSLNLLDEAESVGMYYAALSLNRRGPAAYPQANRLLREVADHGPQIFRAKARVALGTNLSILGDTKGGLSLYAEAGRVANRCQHGTLRPLFHVQIQRAHIMGAEGNHQGAVACLRSLSGLAHAVGTSTPALLHQYYNNLAWELVSNGEVEEARSLSRVLADSPFLPVYPEYKKTLAALEDSAERGQRPFVWVGNSEPALSVPPDSRSGAEALAALPQAGFPDSGCNRVNAPKLRTGKNPVQANSDRPFSQQDLAAAYVRKSAFRRRLVRSTRAGHMIEMASNRDVRLARSTIRWVGLAWGPRGPARGPPSRTWVPMRPKCPIVRVVRASGSYLVVVCLCGCGPGAPPLDLRDLCANSPETLYPPNALRIGRRHRGSTIPLTSRPLLSRRCSAAISTVEPRRRDRPNSSNHQFQITDASRGEVCPEVSEPTSTLRTTDAQPKGLLWQFPRAPKRMKVRKGSTTR